MAKGTKKRKPTSTALVVYQPKKMRSTGYGSSAARGQLSRIPMAPAMGPMGHGRFARLRYVQTFPPPDNFDLFGSRFFYLNNCTAPRVSGGHQPYGFDQMMLFFSRYCVVKAKFTAEQVNIPGNGYGTYGWGLTLQDSSQAAPSNTDFANNAEKPYTKYAMGGCGQYRMGRDKISQTVDIAKFYGITRQALLSDDVYSGTATTGPARLMEGIWWWNALDPDEEVVPQITVIYTVTYDVYFYQPVKLVGS